MEQSWLKKELHAFTLFLVSLILSFTHFIAGGSEFCVSQEASRLTSLFLVFMPTAQDNTATPMELKDFIRLDSIWMRWTLLVRRDRACLAWEGHIFVHLFMSHVTCHVRLCNFRYFCFCERSTKIVSLYGYS
jgi:hypothetical protein